ncbi:MAG: hypothetical protein HY057_13600 [Rhodospirillales bacterium]|nr:hypothetical protein [Rhodospirillales bacterium]
MRPFAHPAHRFIACAFAGLLALAACAQEPSASLAFRDGRAVVLGPEPGFNPAALPADWWLSPPREAAGGFTATDLSGVTVLRVTAPGGNLIGRRLTAPLLGAPYLRWGWYLDPALYGGGAGDGLDRGLRIVIGFTGGTPGGAQLTDRLFGVVSGDYPPHDRVIEIDFGGVGAPKAEDATQGVAALSDRGLRRVLRQSAFGQAGEWHIEAIDLAQLYAQFWPHDRMNQVTISFIATGGLPGRLPQGASPTIGYIAEILLSR